MAACIISALNDWVAAELLDAEPRLRGSILVLAEDPTHAVAEIERLADDKRFVQILLLVMGDRPLGQRACWPIYHAAEKNNLTVCIHAGSTHRHAPTGGGWPSYFVDEYVSQSAAFEAVLLSLIAEGVFKKFPGLKVVLAESGVTWMPQFLWRNDKLWRGVRPEVPWIDRVPREIVHDHVRLTLQPFDAPEDASVVSRVIEHLGTDDILLFSTDYPHWHFDGNDAVPEGLSESTVRKLMIDNPLATYARLS
jgi:predicted TIM-barrel fold metal-dependent hydrolase